MESVMEPPRAAGIEAWRLPEGAHVESPAEIRKALNDILGGALDGIEGEVSVDERFAMLVAGLPDRWHDEHDPSALRAAFEQGMRDAQLALAPTRPIQSNVSTMEPTLSKLPSLRIVLGWFALILALILAFIFMH